jgi:hypothetical protein
VIVGTTVDPSQYETRLLTYPGTRMCRVFGPPNTGIPSWQGRKGDERIARIKRVDPLIEPACTFKDWPNDTSALIAVNAWLDQLDGPTRLAYMHEGDAKNVDATTYRHRWYLLAGWIHNHPNGRFVTLTPTQTSQWTLATPAGKGRGDWSKYYVGLGRPAVDVYAGAWLTKYPDPAGFLEPLWRFRDTIGWNLEFPEFGIARLTFDTTGQGRADWAYACAGIMRAEGVTAVSWWDDFGSNGTDIRLYDSTPDTPEVSAWRAVIAENNGTPDGAVPMPETGHRAAL